MHEKSQAELEALVNSTRAAKQQLEDQLWAAKTATALALQTGTHAAVTCGRTPGLTDEPRAFDATARAIAAALERELHVPAYLLLNKPGSEDPKQLQCYAGTPQMDLTIAEFTERKLNTPATSIKLDADINGVRKPFGELYVMKDLFRDTCFREQLLLNHFAPIAALQLHVAHTIEAHIDEAQAVTRQHANTVSNTQVLIRKHRFDDLLTSFYKKSVGVANLGQAIEKAKETSKDIAVMFIDVDGFKFYNDTYGHMQGDEALKTVAHSLISHARRGDLPTPQLDGRIAADFGFRYGGEEMCLVLYGADRDTALRVAERMQETIKQANIQVHPKAQALAHLTYGINSLPINKATVSIGIDTLAGNYQKTPADLISNADAAMYWIKQHGRNGIRAYDPSMPPAPKKA